MLEIKDLSVNVKNKPLLKNVSLKIDKGQVLGATGASGSGKTTLIKCILGMLDNSYCVMGGSICLNNKVINGLKPNIRRELCGKTIGYIPQNPMTAFDPRMKIGKQVEETLCIRLGVKKHNAIAIFLEHIRALNLEDEERILENYPAEISGGMLQRIAVALTFSMKPDFILADEPTSALDEYNRDILIDILKRKMDQIGIFFVSHDVNALCSLCENVVVMEEGRIIERGKMEDVLNYPKMNWTKTFSEVYKNSVERSFSWMEYQLKM